MKEKSNKHILVTGANRSGTTWVGEMLRLSASINYFYEPFGRYYKTLKVDCPFVNYFHYVTEKESDRVKEYVDCCLSPMNISLKKDYNANPGLMRFFGATYRQIKGIVESLTFNKRFIIKDPLALMSAEWFYETYDCHVLIMLRHPAAYVSSIKRVGWRSDPKELLTQHELMDTYLYQLKDEIADFRQNDNNIVEEGALRWKIYHHIIKQYMEKYPQWLYIKHEDLSLNPVEEFKKIYKTFNLPFSESVESEIRRHTQKKGNDLGTEVHVLERDTKKNIDRWKETLTQKEIEYIRNHTQEISGCFYAEETWE
jgi:hypothetical protein